MNYKRVYDNIIERARERQAEGYTERHHVTPRSMGGTNEKNNVVRLTAREHFICHLLLVEIYPESQKLQYALWAMVHQKNKHQQRDYKVSSRLYERLKSEFAKANADRHRGSKRTPEQRSKMTETRTGRKRGPYEPKPLKFEHTCESCNTTYLSADIKGRFCKECKEPRPCKCGCGRIVKTPGKEYYSGCKIKGKSYLEIYGTPTPKNGFKKGNYYGKTNRN